MYFRRIEKINPFICLLEFYNIRINELLARKSFYRQNKLPNEINLTIENTVIRSINPNLKEKDLIFLEANIFSVIDIENKIKDLERQQRINPIEYIELEIERYRKLINQIDKNLSKIWGKALFEESKIWPTTRNLKRKYDIWVGQEFLALEYKNDLFKERKVIEEFYYVDYKTLILRREFLKLIEEESELIEKEKNEMIEEHATKIGKLAFHLFFAYLIIFFFTIFLFIKWITNKKEKKNSKQETELKK